MRALSTSDAILVQFVQRAKQLYTLPAVALRILELTRDPRVDVRELQQCVESDPALSGKLLRVVNSSLFGLAKPVGDVSQAISMIGIERLKVLVLGFSLPIQSTVTTAPDELELYWKLALLKSVAARELAEAVWETPGDEAFVAGLVQDIGLLVLIQDLGESYAKFLRSVWSAGNDPRELEHDVLGFDHVQLTAALLADWGFPATIVSAVSTTRDVKQLSELPLSENVLPQILCLADLASRFLVHRQARWLDELIHAGEVFVGLTVGQLHELFGQLEGKTLQLAGALSLPLKNEVGYRRLLDEAHGRQSELITELASQLETTSGRTTELKNAKTANHQAEVVTIGSAIHGSRSASANSPRTHSTTTDFSRSPSHVVLDHGVTRPRSENLVTTLSSIVGSCRQSREPVSLALIQLDHCEAITLHRGLRRVPELIEDLESFIRHAVDDDHGAMITLVSASRLGIILSRLDRHEAARVGRQILSEVRQWSHRDPHCPIHLSVSIGLSSLAMPPRNFPVQEMVEAAERCLHGVQLSGGDGLKSIDIF